MSQLTMKNTTITWSFLWGWSWIKDVIRWSYLALDSILKSGKINAIFFVQKSNKIETIGGYNRWIVLQLFFMKNCFVEIRDPNQLTYEDFHDIHRFTQDMWADGSGEFIKCYNCGKISGKKKVFWYVPVEIFRKKVSQIMENYPIQCPECSSWHVGIVHEDEESIRIVQERLVNSLESSAVMYKECGSWELVGYAEAYVDYFERAFHFELEPHYPRIPTQDMKNRIEELICKDVSTVIVFSVLGLSMAYRTPSHLARLLRSFFESTYFQNDACPWIMEIWRFNSVYKMFMWMWGYSLNDTDPEYFKSNLRASPEYDSVIAVFPESMIRFRKKFTQKSVRDILCPT